MSPRRGVCLLAGCLSFVGISRGDDIVRVGLVQMNAREHDKEFNLNQAEDGIRRAAQRGARIVCTPEAAVQGYPRVEFPEGSRMDDAKLVAERARILAGAEQVPGPATERFARLAREHRVWIIFGMDENRGGKLFNSAILMSPEGRIEGSYSKVHLQNWMVASGVNHGSEFRVWEIEIGGVKTKVGIQICYDIQHPESARELALGGAEIVFVPYCTNDFSRPLLVHLFQTRALENRVFLVRVNYGMPRNSGTSSIIDFEGATQDELDGDPGVLVGDLNLTALRKVRAEWNPVYGAPYRRPEAYRRIREGN
ncbi:MAG TPA: carbon-nitrogen hydrolase family protein [Bryobacteraceae bacterium]|nr:carbon-nitrogen hydrolase family protein [Bryobacteraceae bacterium]HUJ23964.1 carbon-nitrogen hydrolase family protein [Bryobacteraceae bacterium]